MGFGDVDPIVAGPRAADGGGSSQKSPRCGCSLCMYARCTYARYACKCARARLAKPDSIRNSLQRSIGISECTRDSGCNIGERRIHVLEADCQAAGGEGRKGN